ncbi:sulfotransferase family protein [Phaeovulum vinaykumarii]|uniref:Sulfotransferase family protein n=1 Tax=Phaeovulum vinaykumarii TaxID=407234 RepID=A0A1N7MKL5_9RHOB|nr:hypothetical protein [Phaeovulum vinaykumarii]SIS86481.1 hypothetical protein SAMN05421795_1085 [Phaeovulum vinaykumarii]SOC13552.1 hypothetical protein SAMN05878426_108141 [Phaeovulum vinaykumarii]
MQGRRPRLVIHAGFHRTASTSVQAALEASRDLLAPEVVVGLRADMIDATESARAYSRGRDPQDLDFLRGFLANYLDAFDKDDPRPLLLSCEDFCGALPGHPDVDGYAAAPRLIAAVAEVAGLVFGESRETCIYFSTRAPGPWLRSLHGQAARHPGLVEDFDAFAARMAPHADLEGLAREIATQVAPVRVVTHPLEACRDLPQGPLTPLLDLAQVSPALRAGLPPTGHLNAASPPEVVAQFIDLNRAPGPKRGLLARKRALANALRTKETAGE